jgi:hypothetical protein
MFATIRLYGEKVQHFFTTYIPLNKLWTNNTLSNEVKQCLCSGSVDAQHVKSLAGSLWPSKSVNAASSAK